MFIIKYRVSLFPTLLTFGDQLDSARQVFNLQYFDPQVVSCSAMATAIFDDRRLRPFRVWLVEYLKLVYILHIYIFHYIYVFFCFRWLIPISLRAEVWMGLSRHGKWIVTWLQLGGLGIGYLQAADRACFC